LWHPPRALRDRPDERRVTFLELFYDLVYVVLIARLAHGLSEHMGWVALGEFGLLFLLVWWAWLNGSLYHENHGSDDFRARALTFLQMYAVVAMAIFAHDPLHEGFVGLALSYAAFQLILTYLWWRTGVHDPDHRPLSRPYSAAFLVSTVLFAASALAPAAWRLWLLVTAVIISMGLPAVIMTLRRTTAEIQAQIELSSEVTPSMAERMGLFTIIVLGEVIAGVISGVAGHHHVSWTLLGIAGFGTAIAIGLWWLYFDAAAGLTPKRTRVAFLGWLYFHLLLAMGIAGTGAAVAHAASQAGEPMAADARWILVTMVGLTLLSIGGLIQIVRHPDDRRRIHYIAGATMLGGALPTLALGAFALGTLPLLGILAVLVLAPIALAVLWWLRQPAAE
jgi:low temperature requirement protein LtrA